MISDSFVPSSLRSDGQRFVCSIVAPLRSAPMVIVAPQTGFDDWVDFERHHTFDRAIPSSRRFASLPIPSSRRFAPLRWWRRFAPPTRHLYRLARQSSTGSHHQSMPFVRHLHWIQILNGEWHRHQRIESMANSSFHLH